MKTQKTNEQLAMQVSRNTIAANIGLFLFKLYAGIAAKSSAMVSDAVHSASDVVSTIIVMIGIRVSSKESDARHPYGHERLECIAAIILAGILCATGLGIGYAGVQKLIAQDYEAMSIPGLLALVAAVVSIGAKEVMYWYTRHTAKKINSGAMMADAWHHRSDAFSSIGSFIGVLGARMGVPMLDPIASIVICFFIVKAAYDIFMDAVRKLTDVACGEETERQISELVLLQTGVLGIDHLRTRLFGNKIYIDLEIRVDGSVTLHEAHRVAEQVHDVLEAQIPEVKHCMVHVNP